jgi:hypothetical protein
MPSLNPTTIWIIALIVFLFIDIFRRYDGDKEQW